MEYIEEMRRLIRTALNESIIEPELLSKKNDDEEEETLEEKALEEKPKLHGIDKVMAKTNEKLK